MILNKKGRWRSYRARQQLSFLMILASSALLPSVQAGSIYQCKQADGRVAFQEIPCAHSDAQKQISQSQRPSPATPAAGAAAKSDKAAPADTPAPTKASIEPAGATGLQACNDAGVAIAQRTLGHPQAAYQACQKELPARKRDQACMEACIHAWLRGYSKAAQ